MTAVTIQSNKIVLNQVKDNCILLEPSKGKKINELFGQPNRSYLEALQCSNWKEN